MDIIEAYQNKLNIVLQNTPYEELNYTTTLLPLAKELLSELRNNGKEFVTKTTFVLPVDIYVEALAYTFVTKYTEGELATDFPNECIILILIRYPYFFNIIQCNRTFDQYIEYRKSLLETFDKMYPMKTNEMVNHVYNLLTTDIEKVYDLRTCSMIEYLHYLIGFRFQKGSVAITADTLPKGDDVSYFIVNLTYNIDDVNNIVIYKDNPKIKDKILNVTKIPKYKCIERPATIVKATEPFIATNDRFNPIEEYTKNVYVLLCYNDDASLEKCHFTIAYYGSDGYVTGSFINNMLHGSLPKSLTDEDVWIYVETTFLKTFSEEPESIDILHEELRQLDNIATKAFDDIKQENKTGVVLLKGFTENVLADKRLLNVLHEEEIPYFKIYLTNSLIVYANNTHSPNLKDMLVTYTCAYIHESAYDNLIFHK